MNKLSIYEFMSYFLPGVLACFVAEQFIPENLLLLKSTSQLSTGLIFSIAAVVVGLCLHNLTHYLLFSLEIKWLAYFLREPVEKIATTNPYIRNSYTYALHHLGNTKLKGRDLFHKAYFYLEYNNTITTAKGFQSMYIFLKNLVVLSLLLIPFLGAFIVIDHQKNVSTLLLFICLCSIIPLTLSCRFYRTKMVEFVLNTYATVIEQDLKKTLKKKKKRKKN